MRTQVTSILKIGKRLKELRIEKNYSQEYLAHELNMTQGNYCKLENDSHGPSEDTIKKLAIIYSVNIQDLLDLNKNSSSELHLSSPIPQKLVEELLSSKDKIIALQAKQIELLESRLQEKKDKCV